MKPSFALSLSFEGIRLLHRAAGGWRILGEAALDSADLAGALEELRSTAAALEDGHICAKILLPNEQVKYLTIDTPGMDDAARRAAAAAALDGATPYPVDDLAYDISADGDQTHVAAVARETLDEAETFAVEHGFAPVSFAAVPGDLPYLGEPYFGPSASVSNWVAPGEGVEPDGIAVVVLSAVEEAAAPIVEEPESPPAPVPEPPEAAAEAAPVFTARSRKAADVPPEPVEPPAQPQAAPPAVGFASRRAPDKAGSAPVLGGATRDIAPPVADPEPQDDPMVLGAGSVTAGELDIAPEEAAYTPPPPPPPPPAPKSGFLSRRRSKEAAPTGDVIAAAAPGAIAAKGSEQDRMTIFGARKTEVGGKPRFLGLILTAALLVFLAGVAAWASVFLDEGLSLSRLFGDREPKPQFSDVEPEVPETPALAQPEVRTASLSPSLTEEDAAVLDALREPQQPQPPRELTEEELEAKYAATGIWPRAPEVPPDPPGLVDLENLYLTSIDPVSTAADAIALPPAANFETDQVLALISSPAAAGTKFALDTEGLVIPTAQGALSPDGFTVFLGSPPVKPPATPTRFQSVPEDTAIRSALAAVRPQPRPGDLEEKSERAQLGGLTRTELAGYRPALRPKSLQEQAAAAAAPEPEPEEPVNTDGAVELALATPSAIEGATKLAARASLRPDTRPRNFSRIVKRAQRSKPNDEVRVASAATIAPRVVQPKIPSKASVAKQATVKNALNLRKVNLIGVYGKPSNRRALVRLGNGRYKKVTVGDRIDGGRVSAIGDSELRYTKRGRDLVLKMPR